jgi:DNA-binding transcriptional regulator GbsR (MarR family)
VPEVPTAHTFIPVPASRPEVPVGNDHAAERLADAHQQFVEQWGRMAALWGVPRSMAEVHALLFVEGRSVNADELVLRLGISRGNASMTLRTLVDWGIVQRTHNKADRKDYYQAEQDVLTLFSTVIRVRKQREIDPLLALVGECRKAAAMVPRSGADHETTTRAGELDRKLNDIELFVCSANALATQFLSGDGGGIGALFGALEEPRR